MFIDEGQSKHTKNMNKVDEDANDDELEFDYVYGTKHPHSRLPLILPSFNEKIMYDKNVSMFLWLPSDINPCHDPKTQLWKHFNWRNWCTAKNAAKLLSVLYSRKDDRINLQQAINSQPQLWNNTNLTNQQKIMELFNNNPNYDMLSAKIKTETEFTQLPSPKKKCRPDVDGFVPEKIIE